MCHSTNSSGLFILCLFKELFQYFTYLDVLFSEDCESYYAGQFFKTTPNTTKKSTYHTLSSINIHLEIPLSIKSKYR